MVLEDRQLMSTIVVNNPTDTPVVGEIDLRQAIVMANDDATPQTIAFAPSLAGRTIELTTVGDSSPYSGNSGLEVSGQVTIDGDTAPGLTISRAAAAPDFRIFIIDPGATLALNDLTVSDGFDASGVGGGGVLNAGGTATLTGDTFIDNTSEYVGNYGASGDGGALFNLYGQVELTDCTVSGNTAAQGGGLVNYRGSMVINGSTVSRNDANYGGGGIFNNGYLELSGSSITNNQTPYSNGGGIFSVGYGSSVNLTACTVSGNTAANGGGINNQSGSLIVVNSTVSNNSSYGGGGIAEAGGTVTVSESTVANNSAVQGGGGIVVGGYGEMLTLTGTTLSGNTASYGGGINVGNGGGGTVTVSESTIANNSATQGGGGIAVGGYGEMLTLTGTTVSGNTASYGGGISVGYYANATLSNTIVAGNTSTEGAGSGTDIDGTVSGSYNLVGSSDGLQGLSDGTDNNLVGTPANPLSASLAILGNYGGPTETMVPLPGSPVIGAGSTSLVPSGVTTDQRGAPLSASGAIDIGAVETQGFTLSVTGGSSQTGVAGAAFTTELSAQVTENGFNSPIPGVTVAFAGPTTGAGITTTPMAVTGANGVASASVTANALLGAYDVTASTTATNTVVFSLTNLGQPVFTSLKSATIPYETSTVTLTGTLDAGFTAAPGCVTVAISGNGIILITEVVPLTNGTFSAVVPTAKLPASPVSPYTVTYTYAGQGLFLPASNVSTTLTVLKASPSISATPSSTVVTLGTSSDTLYDTAVLSGGSGETGTITFTLYLGGKLENTEKVSVTGPGTYATPTGYQLTPGAAAGVYQWDVSYSGDTNNSSSSDNNAAAEQVTVVTPCCNNLEDIWEWIQPPSGSAGWAANLASVHQGDTVTVNFTVPAGDYDQLTLVSYVAPQNYYSASSAYLQTIYQSSTGIFGPGAAALTVTVPNSYYQIDFVCGTAIAQLGLTPTDSYTAQGRLVDSNNGGTTVPPSMAGTSSVTAGETASPAFWCGTAGAALIDSLDGGPSATNLGYWLATVVPNLMGGAAGQTNAQLAAGIAGVGTSGAFAEMVATVMSAYVTDSSLAGNVAASYGFKVTTYGSGIDNDNVGSSGAALGLSNNTSYSLVTLIAALNSESSDGGVYGSATSAAITVFTAVNKAGGIS
jgi:hypothetical protein